MPEATFFEEAGPFCFMVGAARFVNWLHNGMPEGFQDETTTENGVYDLTIGWMSYFVAHRNPGARFFLLNQDEWVKLAHYDPGRCNRFPNPCYWTFASRSDTPPPSGSATEDGEFRGPMGAVN